MILCQDVCREYTAGKSFFAADHVSFHIQKGEFAALIGKSGSGKSTMMNLIGLIDTPTAGQILLDGVSTAALHAKERARLRNEKIGYVFQSFFLDNAYSVSKNTEMPLLIAGVSPRDRKQRICECLERVDMLHRKDALISTLSGGEKQRVCIARAIANRPSLLLADEPCGNLDTENTETIMRLLEELNANGTTVLLVTHSPDEARRAGHLITLRDGKVVSDEA